jgi:glycosyltransferase involved in cell wall biosynthesis
MVSPRPPGLPRASLRVVHVAATANGAGWMHEILRDLRARGHDASAIIAGRDGTLAPKLTADGIPFEVLDLDVRSSRSLRDAAARAWALLRLLRRLRPDVVHYHLFPSILIGRFAGWAADVPVRFSMIPGTYYLETPVLSAADAKTVWADTRVIASCEHTRTLYGRFGVPRDHLELIYYGADAKRFAPDRADGGRVRRELGIAADTPTVGIVAYFYPPRPAGPFTPPHLVGRAIKGHDVLLRAIPRILARVPNAVFLLVGEGWGAAGREYEQQLRALADELGVTPSVRFTGAREDVPDTLAAFDVSVQCSLNENLGGSLESLLMARPLVASAVGGLVDSVRHEQTGLLVPPGDPEALGDAITRLLLDRSLAARLGATGRALAVERFTLTKTVDDLEALYTRHAARASRSGGPPRASGYRVTRSAARLLAMPFLVMDLVWSFRRAVRKPRPGAPSQEAGSPRPSRARPHWSLRASARATARFARHLASRAAVAAHLARRIAPLDPTAPPRVIHLAGATENADWLVDICRRLREDGWNVSAIIGAPESGLAAALRSHGIPFQTMPLSFAPDWGRLRILAYLVRMPLAIITLARLFRRERVQVVHTHIFNTIFTGRVAAWIAGVPARVSMVPGPLHLDAALTRTADRLTWWMDDRVIAGSAFTAARYRVAGLRDPRLIVIPYGASAERFDPARADGRRVRREYHVPDDAPLIGLVAYFYPPRSGWQTPPALRGRGLKGHEDFLAAAVRVRDRYPGARFLLVGSGWGPAGESYRQRLMARCRADGLAASVTFTDFRRDVPDVLAACDVAVQCSLSENYGGTIESLLMATPTVATRVGGMPETARDGVTALLVPPANPAALADAILTMIEQPDRAQALARAGRALMLERFEISQTARAIGATYERLLDRRVAPAGTTDRDRTQALGAADEVVDAYLAAQRTGR